MNIYFRDSKQEDFFLVLDCLFKNLNIPYFVGGSRYFGYHKPSSDLNIFVSLDSEQKNIIHKELRKYQFKVKINTFNSPSIFESLEPINTKDNIKISLIKNEVFDKNGRYHKRIKSGINADRKKIIPKLKELKRLGKNGTEIFHFLKRFLVLRLVH